MTRCLDRPAGIRLVIAEDDPVVSHRLRDLLEDEGFAVVGLAGDTDEALSLVHELDPEVVLSDLRMPGGGGLALLDRLSGQRPRVPVVLLTGYDDPGLRSRALAAGAVAFLSKGCTADEICGQLVAAATRRPCAASEHGESSCDEPAAGR